MDQILPPELNAFEIDAMRQIAAHPAACHIPSAIKTRLKDIGYAKEVPGWFVLTEDGLERMRWSMRTPSAMLVADDKDHLPGPYEIGERRHHTSVVKGLAYHLWG
jgi:hypothetical protein